MGNRYELKLTFLIVIIIVLSLLLGVQLGKQNDTPSQSVSVNINTSEDVMYKVNLNTASKEELMTLPGIGEVRANSIIEYRKTGKFRSIYDILCINGIGEKTLQNIKGKVVL